MSDCEYIVVGSGAGGGTVAARLAEAGKRVVLLEAGGDPRQPAGGLPADYDVPAFHALASENDAMKWDFFVRHYADDDVQRADPKYYEQLNGVRVDGVLYPRAGTLGGCTSHNAMIFVYPHNADWDAIAESTGDASWSARSMRRHFQTLENCRHRPVYRWLAKLGINPTLHGWSGWLSSEAALPVELLRNRTLLRTIVASAWEAMVEDRRLLSRIRWFFTGLFDPNDWRLVRENAVGVRYTPLTTHGHRRVGARERVIDVARRFPDRLKVELDALVTRVLLDENNRAVGVEYVKGKNLYRAHVAPATGAGEKRTLHASREVILAGGAFNTPQLLMLSGIGAPDELRRHGIDVRVDSPGVGKNLQDRYEISVVNKMKQPWAAYAGAKFEPGDRQYAQWRKHHAGLYTSNGSLMTVFRRSPEAGRLPDLFCMLLLARFQGYYPSYSRDIVERHDYLSWVVLKAHTRNRAGEVTLRSNDPRDTPLIDFKYFTGPGSERDLEAVVDGIKYVRRLTGPLKRDGEILEEELPGDQVASDEELKRFVRENAWGHHACGTCRIGPLHENGVIASDFRVHGVAGLRIVDASIFPHIPGYFLASAVYLIGEKAADVILSENVA